MDNLITSDALETLNESQRKQWESSGEWPLTGPDPKAAPETPAPAEAKPAVEAVKPEEQEAESAKPDAEVSEAARTLRRNRSEERKAKIQADINELTKKKYELLEETNRILRERGQSAPPPPQTPPQPLAPQSAKPKLAEFVAKIGTDPAIPDYESALEAFTEARDQANRASWESDRRQQAERQQADVLQKTYQERREAFLKSHPDFDAVIAPLTLHPLAASPTGSALAYFLFRSDAGPQLAYAHTTELQRLLTLSVPDALYELGKLEARLSAGPTTPTPAPTPAPVTVSSAPPPPPQLGTRPGVASDEADAALARGDFAAYARAMNARGA